MHESLLDERWAVIRRSITALPDATVLDRPLAAWVWPTDRHLPQAFLGLQLRDVLALSFDQINETPGVGPGRIAKLLEVLDRVGRRPADEPTPDPQCVAGWVAARASVAQPVPADGVTDETWSGWCQTVRAHRLDHEPLGRFAARLSDLPKGVWAAPLREYADRPLHEIRTMPGHGPARIQAVLEVFADIARTLSGCAADSSLAVRLLPPPVRDLILWAEAVLQSNTVPDLGGIRGGFLAPLFTLLEADLGADTAAVVRRRVGVEGPAETLHAVATDLGLTRERVRQIAAKAGEVMRVRWPEGRYLLDNVHAHFQASPGCGLQLDLMHTILDTCFAVELIRGGSRGEVFEAWERAGRAKRTPMGEEGVRGWAAEQFPDLPSDVVRGWLEGEGFRHSAADGSPLFFSNDPLDRLLLRLHTLPDPVPASALGEFIDGDERSVRARLSRDPRFVEDEGKQVRAAERCGFTRTDGRWLLQLARFRGLIAGPRRAAWPS